MRGTVAAPMKEPGTIQARGGLMSLRHFAAFPRHFATFRGLTDAKLAG
jgi:hypothetical protein